jgi:hypothetical protein
MTASVQVNKSLMRLNDNEVTRLNDRLFCILTCYSDDCGLC